MKPIHVRTSVCSSIVNLNSPCILEIGQPLCHSWQFLVKSYKQVVETDAVFYIFQLKASYINLLSFKNVVSFLIVLVICPFNSYFNFRCKVNQTSVVWSLLREFKNLQRLFLLLLFSTSWKHRLQSTMTPYKRMMSCTCTPPLVKIYSLMLIELWPSSLIGNLQTDRQKTEHYIYRVCVFKSYIVISRSLSIY